MNFKNLFNRKSRAEPEEKKPTTRAGWAIVDNRTAGFSLSQLGYTTLDKDPTVNLCVDKIADLISNMTLYLMENGDNGDIRIKDALAKKVDISPCTGMTRKAWIQFIVRTMLLEGDGNAVVMPVYKDGLLQNLIPLQPDRVSFNLGATVEDGYTIQYNGKEYGPDELLHFVLSPDPDYVWIGRGFRLTLQSAVKTLASADAVTQEFMNGRYMPSIVVLADADNDVLTTPEGRESVLKKYTSNKPGEPWIIPSGLLDVKTVQPLSLKDIAVNETVQAQKKAIASLIGVPGFLIGCGEFNEKEYNNFVQGRLLSIAKVIEQTLTQGLLLSNKRYWKFNLRSLYSYDLNTLSNVGANLYTRGIMTGNEVRDWVSLSPMDGLDELVILENYIPAGMIADQSKLDGNKTDVTS